MLWYWLDSPISFSSKMPLRDSAWHESQDLTTLPGWPTGAKAIYVRARVSSGVYYISLAKNGLTPANKSINTNQAHFFWIDVSANNTIDYWRSDSTEAVVFEILGWSDTAFGLSAYTDYSPAGTGYTTRTIAEAAVTDSFALLRFIGMTGTQYNYFVRKPGSSDDVPYAVPGVYHSLAFAPLNDSKQTDIYIANTNVDCYLTGCLPGVNFVQIARTNKTPASGSWQTVNVSDIVPAGALGVLCDLYNTNGSGNAIGVIAKTGQSLTTTTINYGCRTFQWAPLDANRTFRAYVGSGVNLVVIGYMVDSPYEYAIDMLSFALGLGLVTESLTGVGGGAARTKFSIEIELQ